MPSIRSQGGGVLLPVFMVLLLASVGLLVFMGNQRIHSAPILSMPSHLQARLNARSSAMQLFTAIQSAASAKDSLLTYCDTLINGESERESGMSSCKAAGLTGAITGAGTFKGESASVVIKIAGSLFSSDDTVLFCSTKRPAGGMITGTVAVTQADSARPLFSTSRIEKTLAALMPQSRNDTALMSMPTIIQSTSAAEKIKPRIRGHLFIDGTYRPVMLNTQDTITVLGDLQFTGATACFNTTFRVLGEVRVTDQTHLRNVKIFSAKRILAGGQLIGRDIELSAKKSISIYDHAEISGASSCATFDEGDSANGGTTIYLEDQARFSGSLVSVKGGVRIDRSALAIGVIVAAKDLSCAGQFSGIARVRSVSDRANGHAVENILTGRIGPLRGAYTIPLPWFTGTAVIDGWEEH